MKQNKLLFGLALVIIFSFACKSTYDIRKPNGVQSTVKELGGNIHYVELLSFDSNTLYVLNDGRFQKFNFADLDLIFAKELENKARGPILTLGGLGITGAGVAVLAGGGSESLGLPIVAIGLGLWSTIAGFSHMPKYKFRPPWYPVEMLQLKLYCRFPQGLTQSEIDFLESYYNEK